VRAKFADGQDDEQSTGADGTGAAAEAGDARVRPGAVQSLSRDYVKKILQLPFALPAVGADQLDELLGSIYGDAELGAEQHADLRDRVPKYLRHVAREGRVNPRQVKRFINAYTLQTLVKPQLDHDVVLALQTIIFNEEWGPAYEAIVGDWLSFRSGLSSHHPPVHAAARRVSRRCGTAQLPVRARAGASRRGLQTRS
jgi:KAP family P-loop domain